MSAFVVSDQTINELVSWLYDIGKRGTSSNRYYLLWRLREAGYKLDTQLGCKRLAEEIFTLNCDSIEQRYGEGQAEEFRPLDFDFEYSPMTVNVYQFLKSLRCFQYQCCEGNVPELSTLYDLLERLSGAVALSIVSDLDAYEAASWGH